MSKNITSSDPKKMSYTEFLEFICRVAIKAGEKSPRPVCSMVFTLLSDILTHLVFPLDNDHYQWTRFADPEMLETQNAKMATFVSPITMVPVDKTIVEDEELLNTYY
jgi:hypothetical protein